MHKKFQRKKEDFICAHCGANVSGNGYTNHCPKCLWSRHVDVMPGDRTEICGGLMEPIAAESKGGSLRIRHRCTKCRARKCVKALPSDNREVVQRLIGVVYSPVKK